MTAMAFLPILVNRLAPQAGLEVDRPDQGHVAKQVLERKVPLHEQEFLDQHQEIEQLHEEEVPDDHSPVVVLAVIDRLAFDLKLLDLPCL